MIARADTFELQSQMIQEKERRNTVLEMKVSHKEHRTDQRSAAAYNHADEEIDQIMATDTQIRKNISEVSDQMEAVGTTAERMYEEEFHMGVENGNIKYENKGSGQ